MKPPESVDAYIASFPKEAQGILKKIRQAVRAAAPGAEEKISYRMPAYFQNGPLVYFAAHKHHIGMYPTSEGIADFKKELSTYKGAKGSVQFPIKDPLPLELIRKIVQHRVRVNSDKKRK